MVGPPSFGIKPERGGFLFCSNTNSGNKSEENRNDCLISLPKTAIILGNSITLEL